MKVWVKSGKNEPFYEGMVKARFFKKSQKNVKKSVKNRGQPCRRLASKKWSKRTFFFGFFRNLEITTKNNPKGTSNCFPYDYQPYNFRKSREGGGEEHQKETAPVNVNSAARNNYKAYRSLSGLLQR